MGLHLWCYCLRFMTWSFSKFLRETLWMTVGLFSRKSLRQLLKWNKWMNQSVNEIKVKERKNCWNKWASKRHGILICRSSSSFQISFSAQMCFIQSQTQKCLHWEKRVVSSCCNVWSSGCSVVCTPSTLHSFMPYKKAEARSNFHLFKQEANSSFHYP